MNTQNTPVHIKLWHRGFWKISIANFLLSMASCVFLPTIPYWMIHTKGGDYITVGFSFIAFAIGLFALGPFCSYLVQRYRRNMICIMSILGIAVCTCALYWLQQKNSESIDFLLVYTQRFLFGAFFGLAQMVLNSTLINDVCESFLRTEANHSTAWFSRMALAIGPMTGLLLYNIYGIYGVIVLAIASCLIAYVLVASTEFPFRAPEECVKHFSLDRFILSRGMVLFANLMMINIGIGIIFSLSWPYSFYGFVMFGFLLALLAQHFVFKNADLRSEAISALMAIIAATILLLTHEEDEIINIVPWLIGFGIGVVGSRFLLFFIKLSRHCQRGTSQSTFILSWESGIALGVGLGYILADFGDMVLLSLSLILSVLSLTLYHFYTHKWFMSHKNR